ncbi:MAG: type II secretion system F family protein [Elusimicrobia bacterium]|nr:type II secretion system F family protein [Elusimicrobiota bacterium]
MLKLGMGKFAYTAQDSTGAPLSGSLEARDEEEAVAALRGQGLFILAVHPEVLAVEAGAVGRLLRVGGGGVSGRDLAFLGEQLATLISGGVPLVSALNLLSRQSESPVLGRVLGAVGRDVARGSSLHAAMAKEGGVFDSFWVSLVQAGELGGTLPKSLRQISGYLSAQESLKSRVLTALAYPVVLLSISMAVLAYFIIRIVPTFAEIFRSFDMDLPPITQAVLFLSNFVVYNGWILLAATCAAAVAGKAYLATRAGQEFKARFLFGLPFFGGFIKSILLERFLTTLAALIRSGVSILNALTLLESLFASNSVLAAAIHKAKNDVAGGKPISSALRGTCTFPYLMTEMMGMGEEAGQLPEILETLSTFYREQIDQFARRFTAVIDPILVVLIGGIIGVIVMSIFIPIFQFSQLGMG